MPAGTSYTFKEGMLSNQIERALPEEGEFYKIKVRNQFLHAIHPVGCIKKLEITVDEEEIREDEIYFVLRGQWFIATKMHTIQEVFWHLSETAEIYFKPQRKLTPGKHYVKCTFKASVLEDTQVLDMKGQWPLRVEFVDGNLELKEDR